MRICENWRHDQVCYEGRNCPVCVLVEQIEELEKKRDALQKEIDTHSGWGFRKNGDQVCSLEPSKRLKELGVKQESLFYYVMYPHGKYELVSHRANKTWLAQHDRKWLDFEENKLDYSAFTVAELYKIHCELDPHACYSFPEGIIPEELANLIAEEIIKLLPPRVGGKKEE